MSTTNKLRLMPIAVCILTGLLSVASARHVVAQDDGDGVGDDYGGPIELPGSWRLPAYSAFSNNALLSVGSDDYGNFGVITHGNQDRLFRLYVSAYMGINDKLTTVGTSLVPAGWVGWIRTRDGRVRTFSQPGADVFLHGINNHDVAVGYVRQHWPYLVRPAIADANGLRVVDLPVNTDAWFIDINDSGAIVGAYGFWKYSGFLFQNNSITPIEHEGMFNVVPVAINNRGQVAGIWFNPPYYDQNGFIREKDGEFRTADLKLPFPETVQYDGSWALYRQQPTILDMNDRGQLLISARASYARETEGTVLFNGYLLKYAIVNPSH